MKSKAATYLLDFLLFDFLSLISLLKQFSILLISFNLNFIWSVKFVISIVSIELLSFIFKIFQNYIAIFFQNHKDKQIYAKVSTHYWIAWLYSENICFYVFISNEFFNLFRNVFHSKAIKVNNFNFNTK